MSTTIEDVQYDMHLQEQWEEERREAFNALEKIANSQTIDELQENLDELKNVYSSEIAIDSDNVDELVSKLDFSMPRLREYLEEQNKKSERRGKIYFYASIFVAITLAVAGLLVAL